MYVEVPFTMFTHVYTGMKNCGSIPSAYQHLVEILVTPNLPPS